MRISLITAVCNNAEGLRSSLNSSIQQTHPDVERIVVDGASTDTTPEVLEAHATKLNHIIREPDDGIYDALNKGFRLATGEVFGLLHSDDLFSMPSTLACIAEVFTQTNADLVYGDLCYVRKEKPEQIVRYWRAGLFEPSSLSQGWMPPHPTVYVKRKIYEQIGEYDTQYRIAADYDWMLRLLREPGLQIAYIPEVLVHMRVGGASNRSLKNLWRKSSEDYQILLQHRLGISTLLQKNLRKIGQFWSHPD